MPHRSHRSIAEVERECGLSKDVLRVWERRYGFPAPLRDDSGNRLYPEDQVRVLRLLRILNDLGQRPAKMIGQSEAQLAQRIAALREECASAPDKSAPLNSAVAPCMALVAGNGAADLEARFQIEIMRLGLERFASEVAAPLCRETGMAWERGEINVFQEHIFSQTLARVLRQSIERLDAINAQQPPRHHVLVTTVPGEIHELGMLMVAATLSAQGVRCLNPGPQMPLEDIVGAARAYGCDIVALSFSSWFDAKQAAEALMRLRADLPDTVALWAGGSNAALRREYPQGLRIFDSLGQIGAALA
jgi:DNA-binding transcriptional MerR regulator/methylmalonyl-CoA mutase cobalamin-binding subunit